MSANHWNEIPYSGVPSRCMNLHRKAFTKHDAQRFTQFIQDVKEGKTTIKGKQMFPHELVRYYMSNGAMDDVIELQWKTIADETRKLGTLTDSMVLSDVSGSMSGTPMEVSIALGLLISEVTAAPFTNQVLTFETSPQLHKITGNTLRDRVNHIQKMPWGGSTNFVAALDLLLHQAVKSGLGRNAMPKRLFVISDMQFDQADHGFKTSHQVLQTKFHQQGFDVPTIVYWNVRSNTQDFPTSNDELGVALVSGFSPSILKDLIDSGKFSDPFSVMKKTLSNPRYDIIKISSQDSCQ